MQRKCRYEPLSAQPLVLVLCQVRFSAVRRMERYIPAIQDAFRRTGFPIERAGKVHQVTFTPSGTAPVEMVERQRWEYRDREETWSVLVTEDTVILQTTAYTRFEDFAEQLRFAVNTVLTESEHDGFGVIHRVGFRHITWSVQVPARAFGPTCGEASMEYRTRSSSPDDTSSMSRAEGRRWLAATPER